MSSASTSSLRFSGKYKDRKGAEITAANLAVVLFRQEATHFAYCPALDLTGYGETEEAAKVSFEVTLREFLEYTTTKNTLMKELKKLGWFISGKNNFRVVRAPAFEDLAMSNEALKNLTSAGEPLRTIVKNVQLFANA